MELEFSNEQELFNRIKPALQTKKSQMIRNGYRYIKTEDIWNYLKQKVWIKSHDLSLSNIVHDILDSDETLIDEYLKEQLKLQHRKAYFDDWEEQPNEEN